MLIFFILIFTITAKATEETRYIDSLPEKEKEVFLDRVARRILEEVDTAPSQEYNKEYLRVPENELDVHTEFVKRILREEEANLRKHNTNEKDNLSVKPLNKDRKSIDLTVRSRTRRNDNKTYRINSNTDSDLDNNGEQSEPHSGSKSDEKDIQVKDFNLKPKVNNPVVETNSNHGEVQTISPDIVDDEKSTTEHKTNDVRINTYNFGNAEESEVNADKTNTSAFVDSTSIAEENQSFSKNNDSQDVNDENEEEHSLIDETEITTQPDKVQVKEVLPTDNMTFTNIPVQILRTGDSATSLEEASSKATTILTTEEATTPITVLTTEEVTTPTTTLKQVDNTVTPEQEETTTKTSKSELDAKGNIKIVSHLEEDSIKTKKIFVKNFKTNTVNFGDIDESKTNTTRTNNTNNNLFIDLDTKSKSNVTGDSKTMRNKFLTEKDNSDKNGEIVSASTETMDIISEVNKELVTDDNILKENSKRTLKSAIANSKIDDETVKPNTNHITKINQRYTEETKHEFGGTTQKIEVLTPLIPLKTQNSTETNEKEVNHTKTDDSNIIRVLRDVIERNRIYANGKFDGFKSITKLKEHKVDETQGADKILFIDTKNIDEPYYYPIYNYSPDNAYYNARNKFGPNTNTAEFQRNKEQETNDKGKGNFQTDYFFDESNDRNFKFGHSNGSDIKKRKYEFKLPVIVNPNKLNNDYDYPDAGRTKASKSKDKFELGEIKLKNSIRKIRMMMFANKKFGFIPENRTYQSVEDSPEVTTEKPNLREAFEALLKGEKKVLEADDFNIGFDDYHSRKPNRNLELYKIEDKRKTDVSKIKDVLQNIFHKNRYKIYVIDPAYLKPRSNQKYITRTNEKSPNFGTIRKILNMTDDVDAIPTLYKLLDMNIQRTAVEKRNVDIYADVLADLIQTDNTALVQYDWLGTTVNIRGATMKLLELTQLVLSNQYINPSDFELLKYTAHIYKLASMNYYHEDLRMKLPRGKHMKKEIIKKHRHYLYRQLEDYNDRVTKKDLENFAEFLEELLNSLYELHTAIKNIASITKYNHQNWFKNLKELYLERTRNRTLELLLHFTANRVLDLVESSSKKGLEDNYLRFMRRNEEEVRRTMSEIVFLLKVMNEIENDE